MKCLCLDGDISHFQANLFLKQANPLLGAIICGICVLVRAVSGSCLWQEGVESLEGVDNEVALQVREQKLQYLL